jgi:hypothetical protein
MNDEPTERWLELCALAEKEQDPGKFIALVSEINRLLEENRLRQKRNYPSVAPTAFSC